ncbi:hypothetical protein SHKM778_45580 [Streptomyces sp. KM77-8]|uniref:Uncharacterized protein n=1 Tax=Streptomyces haneummycinicus TaxID=3074435 RepID=A0AAT9HLD5_9ACTN
MQLPQGRSGITAQLARQPSPDEVVMPQCLGLPPAPIQGEHHLSGHPFIERKRLRSRRAFGEDPGVLPKP